MGVALGLLVGYLAGSLPFAYLAGRLLKGVDLRTVGSGNLGATNVYRTLGAGPAVVVLLLDAGKGALPAALLPGLMLPPDAGAGARLGAGLAFGVAAIAGHAKPLFLLFRGGGKGVATAAGVFGALAPVALAGAVAVFAAVLAATRYVSLGSMLAALVLPVLVWLTQGSTPVFWVAVAVALFIVWTHRANIGRLRAGTESRIGRPAGGSA